jgi:hypothetical protein
MTITLVLTVAILLFIVFDLLARVRTLEKERFMNQRGYFLRDDLPIRQGPGPFEDCPQAYSLYTRPFERHEVYAGNLRWAVDQAYKFVVEKGDELV